MGQYERLEEKRKSGINARLAEVEGALRGLNSHLYQYLFKESGGFDRLTIKCKADGEWLGIAKRFGHDGSPEVLFAFGWDFVEVLNNVGRGIAADKWKPDKPWEPDNEAK